MESGKKMLVYDREIACFSKTVAKKRNTAQRFLFRQMKQKFAGCSGATDKNFFEIWRKRCKQVCRSGFAR